MAISDKSCEFQFQKDVINDLLANGWYLGQPDCYDRKRAFYPDDLIAFVKKTQPKQWEKYAKIYPNDTENKFLDRVASQLSKANPNSTGNELRTFGTLGVLRHDIKERGTRFSLCQFKPETI